MKSFFKMTALLISAPLLLSSCGSDKDEPDTQPVNNMNKVFPNGTLSSIGDAKFNYDKSGRLIKVANDEFSATFEYGKSTRAIPIADVSLTYIDREDPENSFEAFFYVNQNGYAKMVEFHQAHEASTYTLSYNSNSQLELINLQSDREIQLYHIYYSNDDIESIRPLNAPVKYFVKPKYTNSTITTPIDNKGNVMMYNAFLGLDLEFLDLAYYAGILGRSTKHLPLYSLYYPDLQGVALEPFLTLNFSWEFNSENFPIKLKIDDGEEGDEDDYITFSWK